MPNNKSKSPIEVNGKALQKFFTVEEKRIEVDKLRENNISKEL